MNSDIRLSNEFWTHRKTTALASDLGPAGVLALIRLWSWVSLTYPETGVLTGCSISTIEGVSGWLDAGRPGGFVSALVKAGFLDETDAGYAVHDWAVWQRYCVAAKIRSDQARKASRARWDKCSEQSSEQCSEQCPNVDAPSPSPSPSPDPNPNPKKTPSIARSRTRSLAPYPPGFQQAWTDYQHFGQRSKKAKAFAVWDRDGLEPLTESVLDWIYAAKGTDDWVKEGGAFVPGMQAWLNGRDFTDPPPSGGRRETGADVWFRIKQEQREQAEQVTKPKGILG